MDSSTEKEKDGNLMKTHFLKPYVTSIDGAVAELPRHRFCVSSSDLKESFSRISFNGFWFAHRNFKSWAKKLEALHEPTWRKAGIFEAIKASTYRIPKNQSLIQALVEKWCPETKSFVFPWGEATVTLEDVMVLLGFSVLGSPVFAPLESSEMEDSVERLEKARVENRGDDYQARRRLWISSFLGRGDQMEHEAFLAMWLSEFVFPDMSRRSIPRKVLPIAVRLARGERIALAPAILARLYRDLGQIQAFVREKSTQNVTLKSLFKLVQVWTWERFKDTSPKTREIPNGEPRIARWDNLPQTSENVRLNLDDFDWRPYTKPLKNWNPPRFYSKEAMWMTVDDNLDDEFVSFARCMRVSQLVGIGIVEDYYPNRVAMQFGLAQDLPGLITDQRSFTEKEAWDDYNKSLDGLKLYMPSCLATTSVTERYQDWWLKSISKFLNPSESTETLNASNTSDDDDDDDVLPLGQMLQKVGESFLRKVRKFKTCRLAKTQRFEIKTGDIGDAGASASTELPLGQLLKKELMKRTSEHLRNKGHKRAREDDESSMDHKDDDITIAQMTKPRRNDKSGSKAKKSMVQRPSNENNSSDPLIDSNGGIIDIVVSPPETRQACDDEPYVNDKSGSKAKKGMVQRPSNENNPSDPLIDSNGGIIDIVVSPPETRQTCDDEPYVNDKSGSKAKKSMVQRQSNENKSSDPLIDSNGAIIDVVVSQPETRQTCDDELHVNGTKEGECLLHEDGENQRCNENLRSEADKEEDIDGRLKQRKLAIEEMALKLQARIMKVEETLAMIRKWETKMKVSA